SWPRAPLAARQRVPEAATRGRRSNPEPQPNERAMTEIDAKMVKNLRDMTGAPMMDCKAALMEASGDSEQAKEILRKKGKQLADKASGREVKEGLVYAYAHHSGKVGVLVEVVCETDFVARNEDFIAFCKGVALTVTAYSPMWLDRESVPPEAIENE